MRKFSQRSTLIISFNDVSDEENDSDFEQQDIRIFQNALDLSNVKLVPAWYPELRSSSVD